MSVLSCTSEKSLSVKVIETSKNGNKLSQVTSFTKASEVSSIRINPEVTYQKLLDLVVLLQKLPLIC
mgnify:CR=1 FL=1